MTQAAFPGVDIQEENEDQELKAMTLIVSMQYEGKIVIAADGMAYTQGDGNANIPYPTEKLHVVKGTEWISVFSGWGGVESYRTAIESEIELGHFPPFDSHLPIGGPLYLNALRTKAREDGQQQSAHVAVAGFNLDGQPYILSAVLPKGATYNLAPIAALGVQDSTAMWLMNTLLACCKSLEDVKRLAYFTVFQIAKQEIKVGHPEHYQISLAVLENGKQPQRERNRYSDIRNWLNGWERGVQQSFMDAIKDRSKNP